MIRMRIRLSGVFSVAVINESVVSSNQNAESSILSYLLLTSDLHGYIEEPGYYFDHTAQSAVKDLDILMLSQGYRRFEWKQILDGHYPLSAFQPEQGINLSGIVETQSGKPVVRGKISIYSPKTNTFLDTLTNDQGKFNFDDINFPDTTKLVIQARKANDGKNVNISLNPTPAPPLNNDPVNDIAPDNIYANVASDNTELQADMALSKTDTLAAPKKLKEVRIKEKKTVKPTEYNGYGSVYQYDANMKVFEGYNSLFDALTRIPGVFLSGGRLLVYDDKPLAVIVDGREMDVIEGQGALRLMAVEDVESVSIVDARQPLVIITTKERAHTDVVKLKDLNITSSRKNTIKFSSNLNGPGNADQVIFGDRLEGCANLLDCLKARLFGISFKDGNFYALRNQSHINYASQGAPTYMIVIVDGGQLSADMLNAYSSDDVNSVEVLTSISHLSLYGSNAPGGVIIVNTKRGSDTDDSYKYKSVPGVIYYSFKGFYQAREFYSPKYDHPQTATDPVDGRTTIYWNPNVNTDKSGKASVEFYNGDGKGLYRTIIEGIDADGNMGHKVYWYKVE